MPPPCVLTLMPAGTRAAWQCAILRNEERAVLPLAKPKAQKYISAISKHGGYSWTCTARHRITGESTVACVGCSACLTSLTGQRPEWPARLCRNWAPGTKD